MELTIINTHKKLSKNTMHKLRQKQRLLESQDNRCCYCGCHLTLETATIDHVIARASGGDNTLENKVVSCVDCNSSFADASPKQKILAIYRRMMNALTVSPVAVMPVAA